MANIENNILFGGPDPVDIVEGTRSLGEFILHKISQFGDSICHIDGVTSQELTFSELKSRSIRYAECLQREGIREGDVVGLCSENRIDFTCALFGAVYLGATVAPLNLTYSESELNHSVNLSRPKILFASVYITEKAVAIGRQNSFIQKVVVFGEETSGDGFVSSEDFYNNPAVPQGSFNAPKPTNIKENVVLILCSSGTTGVPKGVQLTQYNVLTAVSHTNSGVFTSHMSRETGVILGLIPWFHAFGNLTLFCQTLNGLKMVFLPKFEENLFLSCIETYGVTFIFMVPPLMVFLAKHPLVANYDLSSLKELLCGAAPLSKEVQDAVHARLPGVEVIRQGYGMSEMTLSTLVQLGKFMKSGSVGILRPGMYAKVVDTDTGKILGPRQSGEIYFKGSQVMKGYIGNEQATRDTIDKDGWLHTGDIGYFDEDGEFFIIDRLKELIKYKGFQVPPAELEALLLSHPKIKDAAVIGVPDEKCGELPLAFVVKQADEMEVTEQEILDFIAKQTSPAKRLHGGVRFIEEIPKNPSGKILRRFLRDLVNKPKSKL